MAVTEHHGRRRGKIVTVAALVAVLAGMGGLTYAAVPLYQLFCRVTGFGGTTQVAEAAPETIADRVITVRFNTDVGRDMPWRFRTPQRAMTVRVGEVAIAYFSAENPSDESVTGTAVFNVTPFKAGPYFSKIACFCFDEQTLAPGERVEMPVTFFIDPAIMDDVNVDDVNTITLSYTAFRVAGAEAPEPVALNRPQGAGPARDVRPAPAHHEASKRLLKGPT